jgi:hypothetical protein
LVLNRTELGFWGVLVIALGLPKDTLLHVLRVAVGEELVQGAVWTAWAIAKEGVICAEAPRTSQAKVTIVNASNQTLLHPSLLHPCYLLYYLGGIPHPVVQYYEMPLDE